MSVQHGYSVTKQRGVYGWVEGFKGKLTNVDADSRRLSTVTCAHQSDYLGQPKINTDEIAYELRMGQM